MTPSLAESWSMSPDGLVYEFVLRKGVKFHNDEPVTAEDVKCSFERYRVIPAKALKARMAAVDVLDTALVPLPVEPAVAGFHDLLRHAGDGGGLDRSQEVRREPIALLARPRCPIPRAKPSSPGATARDGRRRGGHDGRPCPERHGDGRGCHDVAPTTPPRVSGTRKRGGSQAGAHVGGDGQPRLAPQGLARPPGVTPLHRARRPRQVDRCPWSAFGAHLAGNG